jgi:hypothetical protein
MSPCFRAPAREIFLACAETSQTRRASASYRLKTNARRAETGGSI